jgi:hypothetical protein
VNNMPWWQNVFWDWFWYYRRGKIRYRVWDLGYECKAMASDGKVSVWKCYGSTKEAAKEMALFRLNQALTKDIIKRK